MTIEYCNLPMRTAFLDRELAAAVEDVIRQSTGHGLDKLRHAAGTFHQLVCLNNGGDIPEDGCRRIYRIMERWDRERPVSVTTVYPYLKEREWSLSMKDVSYLKVDIRKKASWSFSIEAITKRIRKDDGKPFLVLYPYEGADCPEFEVTDGRKQLTLVMQSEEEIWKFMKEILLAGTVEI